MKIKEILVITNDKGGVGKTTTAVNLAVGLKKEGFDVLLIDIDSQRYASFCMGWTKEMEMSLPSVFDSLSAKAKLPVYKSKDGVYYTPSSLNMNSVDKFLQTNVSPCKVLQKVFMQPLDDHTEDGLTTLAESFDYVVIDCPPSMGGATLNAMAAGSGLIIPVQLEGFAVRGMVNVMECYKEVKDELNPGLDIRGFLLVMVNPRLKLTKKYIADFEKSLDGKMFHHYIRRDQKVPESQDNYDCVLNTAPYQAAGLDYRNWIKELLNK